MGWRDTLEDYQQARVEQVENYAQKFGYKEDTDQDLIATLIGRLDNAEFVKQKLFEARPFWVKWIDKQVQRNAQKFDGYNYYTCRLFRRIDWFIYWIKGQRPHWTKGRLAIGHSEATTYFPGRAYRWACDLQNKHYWTRIILNI